MSTSGVQYEEEAPEVTPEAAKQLPTPQGFRLLIAMVEAAEKTEGGIIIPGERQSAETVASVVGFVIDAGADAYADEKRFPNGPWCKKGDFVVMEAYSGVRLKIHGKEFRLINDDSVQAVVEDPRGIVRA